MKQDNTTPIPQYLVWWNGLSDSGHFNSKDYYANMHYGLHSGLNLKDSDIEFIYKAENPSQPNKGEGQEGKVSDVSTTDWALAGNIPDDRGYWHIWDKINGIVSVATAHSKQEAERIVTCVNGWDEIIKVNKMYSRQVKSLFIQKQELINQRNALVVALNNLIEVSTRTTANLLGFDGADELDNSIDEAKAILNTIK